MAHWCCDVPGKNQYKATLFGSRENTPAITPYCLRCRQIDRNRDIWDFNTEREIAETVLEWNDLTSFFRGLCVHSTVSNSELSAWSVIDCSSAETWNKETFTGYFFILVKALCSFWCISNESFGCAEKLHRQMLLSQDFYSSCECVWNVGGKVIYAPVSVASWHMPFYININR